MMHKALTSSGVLAAGLPREFRYDVADFQAIAQLLEERTGIHLAAHKEQLVYARLAKRLRPLGFTSFRAYRDYVTSREGAHELLRMVNALTTNLTRFFREPHHFEHLRRSLSALAACPPPLRRLRFWSAGCSTGQEAYSIALTLVETMPDIDRWDARILATDIDTDVLAIARRGRYAMADADGLDGTRRSYFCEVESGDIEVLPRLRSYISFKPLNLVGPWPLKGPFDAIFCRNVAIYFRGETQSKLFARFRDVLAPNGFLYVGHSESIDAAACGFQLVGQTTYRPL
jgi:chemotaxis protein methyltransferase CheR